MNTRLFRAGIAFSMWLLLCASVKAQTNPNLDEIGLKPYGSFEGGNIDSVALSNGNLNLKIPFFSYPQRGSLPGNLFLTYNGKNWWVFQHCNLGVCTDQWRYNYNSYADVHLNYDALAKVSWQPLVPGQPSVYVFTAKSSDGAPHFMLPNNNGGDETADGSGIYYSGADGLNGIPSLVIDRSGRRSTSSVVGYQDANGNQVTYPNNIFTDTLNRPLGSLGSSTTDYSGCVQPSAPHSISAAYISNYPGPNGTNRQIKYCRATYSLSTNFNATDPDGNPIQEGTASATFNVSFVIYNGSSWATSPAWGFDYQNTYGDLTKVTLPTGGTISYGWGNLPLCTSSTALAQVSRALSSRTVDPLDGTGPQTWGYAINTYFGSGPIISNMGTIVTDPYQNQTLHYMTQFGDCGYYENKTAWFQGSRTTGTLLKTQTTDYVHTTNPYVANLHPAPDVNVLPIRVTTTWPNGNTTKVETDHDANFHSNTYTFSYGEVTAVREYDYGTTANVPGPLLRTTTNAYYAASDSTYLAANLLDLISSTIVTNGVGTQIAKSTYSFDGYTLQSSGITTQRDTTVPNPGKRGNLTSSCQWLNTTGGNICKYIHYFDTGMPYQVTDPLSNVTTYSYSPTYIGAYLTQTNMPDTGSPVVHHIVSGTYDFNTGSITSYTDQNTKTSNYSYDPLGRVSLATFPDGGQTSFIYTDTALNAHVERTQKITSSLSTDRFVYFDGLARTKQTQLVSDPSGTTFVDTTYDALGRVHSVSNPHRSGSSATDGIASYVYDILGRTCVVVPPDGTAVSGNNCPATQPANDVFTTYLGNTATVTDQAGKARKSQSDGLGRLTSVWEDPAALNYLTSYGYNSFGNLSSVLQNGSRSRTFTYNSLSQLLTAINPESGTITYSYDDAGNVLTKVAPAPNQTGTGTVTTTYGYDALNRLTQKYFSDTTPTIKYGYDAVAPAGCTLPTLTINNGIGKRTGMCDAGGAEAWSYDITAVGWKTTDARTTVGVTKTSSAQNNFDGSIASLTYPSTRVLNYTYSTAARPVSAIDPTGPVNYATLASYSPPGGLTSVQNGANTIFTSYYDKRLQPCRISVKSSGTAPGSCIDAANIGNVLDFTYNFNLGTTDSGNVYGITNNRDTTRSQSFTYDALNRISTAKTTSTTGTKCWDELFGYDAWGNLMTIGRIAGYSCSNEELLNVTPTTKNQISGYTYDSAGNLINDGLGHAYVYNAENQLTSAGGASYIYDGDGKRVDKTTGKLFWYGLNSDPLDETDLTGSTANSAFYEYAFFGGKRIARRDFSNVVIYYFADHLGTARIIASSSGTVLDDSDYYPFGGERVISSSSTNSYKFTGKKRDLESGLDNFGARYMSSSMGRFMTPDWSAAPMGVPYADLTNPQSLNLYAMVQDNPESFADLDGHKSDAEDDCVARPCSNKRAADTVIIVKPRRSLWKSVSAFFHNIWGGISTGIFRPSSRFTRGVWEKANGRPWPKDPVTNRNLDADHDPALVDGGDPNDPKGITPRTHEEHVRRHSQNGDFRRWAMRRYLRFPGQQITPEEEAGVPGGISSGGSAAPRSEPETIPEEAPVETPTEVPIDEPIVPPGVR